VDVTLFTTVDALDAYLCHPNQRKLIKYSASLFRIVTNRRLYVGPDALLSRLRRNALWCSLRKLRSVMHCNRVVLFVPDDNASWMSA